MHEDKYYVCREYVGKGRCTKDGDDKTYGEQLEDGFTLVNPDIW